MTKKLSYNDYYDKVLGGWIGKCAGGILGAPLEGFKRFHNITYSDELFATNFANDDLDLQVLWLDMLLKKGKNVRESDFKQHWLQHVEFPWCEYGIAARNMRLGLDNPNTGEHNNWYWQKGMGSPIRSEIWGMVHPGMPKRAAFYAGMDSRLDHAGFSVHAEQYLSACEALAFFDNDVVTILKNGLEFIPLNSDCHRMIVQVMDWYDRYDFEIVAGKIKSSYGDADFTAAPMNIAFTILSLLNCKNSFDFLIQALNLGHDSDCIVATAGSLLGTVLGYKAIPEIWRKRVGNELLISPEVSGIYCPETITELAELTCKVGVNFMEDEDSITIYECPVDSTIDATQKTFEVYAEVKEYPNFQLKKDAHICLHYENLTDSAQDTLFEIQSPFFKAVNGKLSCSPLSKIKEDIVLSFKKDIPFQAVTKFGYRLIITNHKQPSKTFEKGIPTYGSWLLLGPFIEDDRTLEPPHKSYPDHGMSSLPSVVYMNHDQQRSKSTFLDMPTLEGLLRENSVFDQGFQAQIIFPQMMRFDLAAYFMGTGERTLYLYTEIESKENTRKWLCIGSTGYLQIVFNEENVYKNNQQKRLWPMAHACELDIKKGKNRLLIRIDVINDDFAFEIGLKQHEDKHYHQSHWEDELQFMVPENLAFTK